uniref:Defective in cullin neddylation protein n=1 Tax=Panagrellus redivivus TaxID=6233 RepID=A0A7E5A0D0_PANRE
MSWSPTSNNGMQYGPQYRYASGSRNMGYRSAGPSAQQSLPVKSKSSTVRNLFYQYANDPSDNLPGRIGPNGVVRLLQDVKAEPTDCSVLIFAWKCKAQTQCEFSVDEWNTGLTAIRCSDLNDLRAWFKNARNHIQNPADFKDFYKFTFTYAKSLAQRGLPLDVAIAYWQIIYDGNTRVNHWIQWLQNENKSGITQDEWDSFGAFIRQVKADFSNYDETWPTRIDDYVEFCKSGK